MRGGEKCLASACDRWPDAPLYTLIHQPGKLTPSIEQRPIRASFLDRLPKIERYYRYTLPIMPLAARWPIRNVDLVLSFSHCVAKSAQPPEGVPHICYCFTPMRYAWHMRASYFQKRGLKSRMIDAILKQLREWDRATASRVTHFVAISKTIQQRIKECYNRDSVVIYPPVDTVFYTPDATIERENFYLVVSALAPYKRFDLAIEACERLNRKLIIIGSGQDIGRLQKLAGPHTTFLGWQSDTAIRDAMRRCKALLFPGEEDFGIVPIEAQACGTPVIAFNRGGATETLTGIFFDEQTVESMIDGIEQFEREATELDPRDAVRNADRFRKSRYEDELFGYIDKVVDRSAV